MELIVNLLLIVGTLSAATYSWVLSRRVRKLTDLDQGLGAAIKTLSFQVDDMRKALLQAQQQAGSSTQEIKSLTDKAERAATRLELLLAGMHEKSDPQQEDPARDRKRKIAELRRQKSLEAHMAQERPQKVRKVVGRKGPDVTPPNHESRQELLDSITNIIGNLQK